MGLTVIKAEIEGNRIYIDSALSDKEDCQSIAGSRWSKNARVWTLPISWASCKSLRAVFGDRLEIGPALLDWAQNELTVRISPSMALRDQLILEDDHWVYVKLRELGLV